MAHCGDVAELPRSQVLPLPPSAFSSSCLSSGLPSYHGLFSTDFHFISTSQNFGFKPSHKSRRASALIKDRSYSQAGLKFICAADSP